MIFSGQRDGSGRAVSLRPVDDGNWRAVADVAPRDEQRRYVPALAARYLVLTARSEVWHSLAVHADDEAVGHVMWGRDPDDGSYWIGGMLVDAAEQGRGVGRATVRTLLDWLASRPDCRVVRLSYHPENLAAARLYTALGFTPTGEHEDDEIVVEYVVPAASA